MLVAQPIASRAPTADQIERQVRGDVHPPERDEPRECREPEPRVPRTFGHVVDRDGGGHAA